MRARFDAHACANRSGFDLQFNVRFEEARIMLGATRNLVFIILAVSFAGCSASIQPTGQSKARLYSQMGDHHYPVTTSSSKAQKYFDQGLIWAYAFNHDEAIRSFTKAAQLDPNCAMAWWGVALCNGPHINFPIVPPDRVNAAWEALQKSIALKDTVTQKERDLIDALANRYANPQPDDRRPLDQAYADAMANLWEKYPSDADIGTLYAEALMDLRPWDLWTRTGQPKPGAEKIVAQLERVLELDPQNPGANHLYIHAVEASAHPDRANAAADRLRELVPASGHLIHMPSHIDVLTGRWTKAAEQNEQSIKIDRRYRAMSPSQEFYRVYMLHNHHMLAFASMMEGRSDAALAAARGVVDSVPAEFIEANGPMVDPYMGAAYDALKRFGRWDEILQEPPPPSVLPITTAMWRFHRGLAYAAKGEIKLAEQEQAAFRQSVSQVPEDALMAINPAHKILAIADLMLEGEIALALNDYERSAALLRRGVELEDELLYMEPPEWIQPVRHTLAAVLVENGQYQEAERVYREDLANWPGNGWSLYGLARCLEAQDKDDEAMDVRQQFRKAWSRADTDIWTSCLCVRKS